VSVSLGALGLQAGRLVDLYLQDASGEDQAPLYLDDLSLIPR
jgi:hypothetical protein